MAAIRDDQHFPGHWDAEAIMVVTCATLSIYNALELILLIFSTFKEWRSLYFWSLTVASIGVLPYFTGFICEYFQAIPYWASMLLSTTGWITMVTGQSFVLYSRLGLIVRNVALLKAVKWMVIVDAIIFHTSVTVVQYGKAYGDEQAHFGTALFYLEKIQMTGFCIQEFILSGIYLWKTVELLRIVSRKGTRRVMIELFIVNVIIVLMDIGLLFLEYDGLRTMERTWKGLFYSIKLKLEFVILGKLVDLVQAPRGSSSLGTDEISTFVDISKSRSYSQAARLDQGSGNLEKVSTNDWLIQRSSRSECVEDAESAWPTRLNGPGTS